jgi:small GTP-binding protein
MSIISKKVCLVGDFGVGKTSLIRRFVDRQFSDQYLSTVGVKISKKTVEIVQEKQAVQLLIWDLEGHTKFKAIAPTYLKGGSGAVIVADVTRTETIERIPEHIELFLSVNPQGSIVVALNKSDLIDEEKFDKLWQMVKLESEAKVAQVYPSSAKTGLHVDEIFYELACRSIQPTV